MMIAADIDLAVTFLDASYTLTGRSLIATTEVVDMLLDLRALVTIDLIGPAHV